MSPGGLGVDRVTTERLVGRRPDPADLEAIIAFFGDPRVDEAHWPSAFRTPERAKEVLDGHLAHWERWDFGPWLLELDGQVIGWDGLRHDTVAGRPEVEALWFVSPDHWGKGYATEMAREAVRVAFEVLELDSIVSYTVPVNGASRAIMEKLGMTYERDIEHVGMPHVLYRLSR
jgi:ribosomal-protein-alanine N-acetyltransferase